MLRLTLYFTSTLHNRLQGERHFFADEIDYIHEVTHVLEASCTTLDDANLRVGPFQDCIGPQCLEVVEDLNGVPCKARCKLAYLHDYGVCELMVNLS